MRHRIESACHRTLTRLLTRLIPATGRRRKPATPRTASGLRLLFHVTAPPRFPAARPRPRRPRFLDDSPAIDSASPLVRPYVLAHERQERRTALALALDGIDVGPWVIHGHPVGTPAMGVAA